MAQNTESLIEQTLPRHRIHLLGGLTDAGKTRWVLPMLFDWQRGLPVLGRISHPCPWAYVAGDRPLEDAQDTIRELGLRSDALRIVPAYGRHNKDTLGIFNAAKHLEPVPELLVIEGFRDLCPEPETRRMVREFMSGLSAYLRPCQDFPEGLTILGVVETPKQEPAKRYPNPRQRISGPSAWGYHSSTVFLIETLAGDPSGETSDRILWVCTKGCLRRKLVGAFDASGRLIF